MDIASIRFLRSDEGIAALASLGDVEISDEDVLGRLTELRARHTPEQAAALVETVRLRHRASLKFGLAHRMLFDREGLEQATGEKVARHRARRLARLDPTLVHDLGCGIGGDAAMLSDLAPVVVVDVDPARTAMAVHNVAVHGGVAHGVVAEAETDCWMGAFDVVFLDPARRSDGRRRFDPQAHRPTLGSAFEIARGARVGVIKTAPGIDHAHLPLDAEAEFVSHEGDMKECVVWFGEGARQGLRTASIAGVAELEPDHSDAVVPVSSPMRLLFEPDAAVIRAGLVQDLARRIGGRMLDPQIAYLTLDTQPDTPFGRCYQIESWMPFQLKRLRAHLRALDVGSVTIKKRGSAIGPEDLRHRLRLDGSEHRVVVLTRVQGQHVAIVAREPSA